MDSVNVRAYDMVYHRRKFIIKGNFIIALIPWLFVIINGTYYIKNDNVSNMVQAGLSIVCLWYAVKNIFLLNSDIRKMLCFYLVLILLAFLQDIISGHLEGTLYVSRFLLYLTVLIYVNAACRRCNNVNIWFILIPVMYGFIISVQGLLLEFMSVAGLPIITKPVVLGPMGIGDFEIHGLGMVKFDAGKIFGAQLIRIKAFYLEPSYMAHFLSIPLFFSWGLFKKFRKRVYKFMGIVIAICFLFTISRSGYVAIIASVVITCVIRGGSKNKRAKDKKIKTTVKDYLRLGIAAVFFLILSISVLRIMVNLYQVFPEFGILYRGITDQTGNATLVRKETFDTEYILQLMKDKPLGYGFAAHVIGGQNAISTNFANAFAFWLITGGIFAGILSVILVAYLMVKYCVPCLKSSNPIKIAIAQAFIANTIHSLSGGTWISLDYLMLVGLMIASTYKGMCFAGMKEEVIW